MVLLFEWRSSIFWHQKFNKKRMKVTTKDHTIIIKDTEGNSILFLEKINNQYTTFKDFNLILDISNDESVDQKSVMLFSELSKKHLKAKKSFMIVAKNVDFNKIPASLSVVPSLLEAHDMIEMDEIERDLGF